MWIPFGCLGFACFAHQELMGLKYSYFVLGLVLTQSEGKKHGTWIQAHPRTLCWVGLCRPRLINLVGLALPIYGPKSYAWAIQCTGPLLDSFLFFIYIYIYISLSVTMNTLCWHNKTIIVHSTNTRQTIVLLLKHSTKAIMYYLHKRILLLNPTTSKFRGSKAFPVI